MSLKYDGEIGTKWKECSESVKGVFKGKKREREKKNIRRLVGVKRREKLLQRRVHIYNCRENAGGFCLLFFQGKPLGI